jgi:PAS domain S-box-containing protein
VRSTSEEVDERDDVPFGFATGGAGDVLQTLFDAVPIAMGYWDADLRTKVLNETAARWLGYTVDEARGLHVRELLGEEVFQRASRYIDDALAGSAQLIEFVFIDSQGTLRHGEASLSPDVVDCKVVGISVALMDRGVRGEPIAVTRQAHPPLRAVDGALVEPLTERERDVLWLLPSDLSTTEMAEKLEVSLNTVKTHLKAIYRKLGVNSRRAAVSRGVAAHLLHDDAD